MNCFSFKKVIPFLAFTALLYGCSSNKKASNVPSKFVHAQGLHLVDSTGHILVLHGINIMDKGADGGHFDGVNQAAFNSIRSWGMNAVRLGIFWSAIEPTPGKIDTSYLKKLDKRIKAAGQAGLYVLLDMHQDLYSPKYNGDGAPAWACLDEGKPNIAKGSSWSDAYFTSPAIQTAFDNFWANKKLPDGSGVQDHYIHVWKVIAKRYAKNSTVIGYDIMNEPFIGSPIKKVMQTYFSVLMDTLKNSHQFDISNKNKLMELWISPKGRARVMTLLNDTTLYKKLMDATEPIYTRFETQKLQPFYQKVFKAIQSVDTNHLLFLEPSVSANIGVRSHLQNTFGKYMAYAPHTYDIVTDTQHQKQYSLGRLHIILERHRQTQKRLGVPMVMGEWGAFYHADSSIIPQVQYILKYMDSIKAGNFYWAYQPNLNKRSYFNVLKNQVLH